MPAAPARARLSLVHVAAPPGRFSGGRTAWSPPEEAIAADIAAEARRWLGPLAAHRQAEAVVLRGSDPAEAILTWAQEAGCDLLVVHPRRRGVARWVLGSVAERLVRDADVPVLVVPGTPGGGPS